MFSYSYKYEIESGNPEEVSKYTCDPSERARDTVSIQLHSAGAAAQSPPLLIQEKLSFGSGLVFPGGKLEPQIDELYRSKFGLASALESAALR